MSLTLEQARERAALLTVTGMSIDLDLTRTEGFTSTSTIEFTARDEGARTFVDCAGRITSATLNDVELPLTEHDGRVLPLTGLAPENVLVVTAEMDYSHDGEGLHEHIDAADGSRHLYAMSFLDAAPRWFACFDQPDLKAPCRMRVTCPGEWTVLGNGRFTRVADVEGPDRATWEMAETAPLATYFVTLVAGEMVSHLSEHDGITLGFHTRQSLAPALAAHVDDMREVTAQAMDAYHELFGIRYPFGDYHQAFVPDFNAGAMENAGCVTLRDEFLFRGHATRDELASRASTIAHELAHQWFGDLVTMTWWDDLWLNESFAEFLAHVVCEEATAYPLWVGFGMVRKAWGVVADEGPATHPVAANRAQNSTEALGHFDGISYAKGAAVLKQLRAELGDDIFWAGLRQYIGQHRFGNATLADLLAAWRDAGAEELDAWAQVWLTTTGLDTLTATGTSIVRTPGTSGERRPHTITIASLDAAGELLGEQTVAIRADTTAVALPAGLHVPDAHDEAWAAIRPSAPPDRWPPLARIANPMTRVVLWNSLRSQVRYGTLPGAQALDIVLRDLPEEPEPLIITAIGQWALGELAGILAPPTERHARVAKVAGMYESLLQSAEPGSDTQLVALRGQVESTCDVAWLLDLLGESLVIPGRPLDQALRWAAVRRVMMLQPDDGLIECEIQRDRSSDGLRQAARARASRATTAAKREAFELIMSPSDLPASRVTSTALGLFLAEQHELTAHLAEEWFDRLPGTSRFRSGWALGRVALQSFPLSHASAALVERCEALLADTELAPGLRRALLDGADVMRRCVAQIEG